ncbi:hypothetical protein ACIA8C_26800 [Nocardia sp. NPDC051321]|uniref:hypothetical protein n=1 Tax=Nocardia sp. NPDC051321 TaxID=3364323 RepID=UPI0037B38902
MTSSETPPAASLAEEEIASVDSETSSTTSAEEGVHQIPTVIRVTEPAGARDAREALLAGIGAEANYLATEQAGKAAGALLDLARAYAIVMASAKNTATDVATSAVARTARSADQFHKIDVCEYDINKDEFIGNALVSVDDYAKSSEFKTLSLSREGKVV